MSEYAFDGNTIKLKQADYDRWIKAFKNIPNLDAVLQSRDDWLTYDAEIKTQNYNFRPLSDIKFIDIEANPNKKIDVKVS